ncbi:MAG: S24 family peptidase [Candidatus Gracilibacteria bacterium]|jgi:SOS-response transcriptional repressor LexA
MKNLLQREIFSVYSRGYKFYNFIIVAMKRLDSQQKKILSFLEFGGGESYTLMDIGESVGIDHPQKVQNKINQLENAGYVTKTSSGIYRVLKHYDEGNQLCIPFFGFAQCGHAGKTILEDEYPRKKISVDPEYLDTRDIASYFITKAKGDSMEPFIHSGDLVLIKIQSGYHAEDMVLIVQNQQPKIKRIKAVGDQRFLLSLNKAHKDLELTEFDETHIVGVVKHILPEDMEVE